MKFIKIISIASLLGVMTACSNHTFQGHGQYVDAAGVNRDIVLEYKTQVYYIPFVENDIGSVSLTAECLKNSLQDSEINETYGLIFKESTQDFTWAVAQPKIKVGRHLICAKLKNEKALLTATVGNKVVLQTFCEAKNSALPILPVNEQGYTLVIKEVMEADVQTEKVNAPLCAI